jgi:hypothetical protein
VIPLHENINESLRQVPKVTS